MLAVGPAFHDFEYFLPILSSLQRGAFFFFFEKSVDSLVGTSLQVTNFFSLAAFKIVSLSLAYGILIIMCLGEGLFVSILFGTLCAS